MVRLFEQGAAGPPPLAVYPLDAGPKALQQMKAGGVRGKIVLNVAG
jgi:hypothetical protein